MIQFSLKLPLLYLLEDFPLKALQGCAWVHKRNDLSRPCVISKCTSQAGRVFGFRCGYFAFDHSWIRELQMRIIGFRNQIWYLSRRGRRNKLLNTMNTVSPAWFLPNKRLMALFHPIAILNRQVQLRNHVQQVCWFFLRSVQALLWPNKTICQLS